MAPNLPSIFNDVIGPVIRSHRGSRCTAGSLRRPGPGVDGRTRSASPVDQRAGLRLHPREPRLQHQAFFGGLLGWDAQDSVCVDATAAIRAAGIQVELRIADFGDPHPNTYRLTLKNADEPRGMIALSTGGGMIEVIDIDGFPLSLKGDYFETLIYANSQTQEIIGLLKQHAAADDIALHAGAGNC